MMQYILKVTIDKGVTKNKDSLIIPIAVKETRKQSRTKKKIRTNKFSMTVPLSNLPTLLQDKWNELDESIFTIIEGGQVSKTDSEPLPIIEELEQAKALVDMCLYLLAHRVLADGR